MSVRLGVNIDHVATLRQARGGAEPQVLTAASAAIQGGADLITMHLREDRRHIQDRDVFEFKKKFKTPLNLEMAATPEMLKIALRLKPHSVCLVPEKRQELTTEGGLDLSKLSKFKTLIARLQKKRIQVFPFVDPDLKQIHFCKALGCEGLEIHTGAYANRPVPQELRRIQRAAEYAQALGLAVHAGHGLNLQNIKPLLKIKAIEEFNIGHSIISRAVFVGLKQAVAQMKKVLA